MRQGDIYLVQLPVVEGREQAGSRPTIIIQDPVTGGPLPTVLIVPLTSQLAASRFPGTLVIEPDDQNSLMAKSVALVFQTRSIDRRRLGARLGSIKPRQLEKILQLLDQLLGKDGQFLT